MNEAQRSERRVDRLVGPQRVPPELWMFYSGCGCPHEEWDYSGGTFGLHQDEGLPVQTVVCVDEDAEIELPDAPTFEAAREQACRWIDEHMRPNV